MMKQPDQELFDELYRRSHSLGLDTFTYLPEEGTAYPFVVIDDTHLLPRATKSHLIGRVTATVHVWGEIGDRRAVSDMIGLLMREYSLIHKIDERTWHMDLSSSSQIIKDNSTDEMLYHGIIDLEFTFI